MRNIVKLRIFLFAWLSACSSEHASTIGQFGKSANFPMYYMVGGDIPQSGDLYKVTEVSVGQIVESELVASGMTAPGGMAQDTVGNIYITETLPAPDGRVLKIPAGGDVAKDFMIDLDYPTGVALDMFNQVYIIENGQHRVTKYDATGAVTAFKNDEIGSPEAGVMDANDNLYLVESQTNIISKIDHAGNRQVISPPLEGIRDIAIDAAGIVYVLWADSESGTGKIFKLLDENTFEAVMTDLISPMAIAFDSANALYIAEGAPVNRISRFVSGEASRRIIVNTAGEPRTMIFTPY